MNKATEGKHLSKLRFNAVDVLIVALLVCAALVWAVTISLNPTFRTVLPWFSNFLQRRRSRWHRVIFRRRKIRRFTIRKPANSLAFCWRIMTGQRGGSAYFWNGASLMKNVYTTMGRRWEYRLKSLFAGVRK